MHKVWMLAVVLVALTVGMQAQANDTAMGQNSASQMGQSSGQNTTTVEGCLQGSSGSYTLMGDNGTTYQLSGDTAKLAEHVGHEIQVTGMTSGSSASSASSSGMGSTSGGSQTLEVKSVKHLSKTCKSSGMSH
jgi:hypothetical protein